MTAGGYTDSKLKRGLSGKQSFMIEGRINMVKNVFKKALSYVLSVCVLAGTMLLTAQAVPDQNRNQIGNYVTVDSNKYLATQFYRHA